MDDMQELVTRDQIETVFRVLALAGPVVGAGAGFVYGKLHRRRGLLVGLALGCLGTANYGLWHLYLAVTDRLGMDRVSTFLINLGLFVVLGIGVGLLVRRFGGRNAGENEARSLSNRNA